jgi:hypothetical protein
MNRLLITTALTLLAAVAPAAPVPKDDKPVPYFPTKLGARWVYVRDDHDGSPPSEDARVVIRVVRDRETYAVSVGMEDSNGTVGGEYERVFVHPGGLSRECRPVKATNPEQAECILKLLHRLGTTWETTHTDAGGRSTRAHFSRGPEDVEVPAGKYRALRVDAVDGSGDDAVRWSWWFAPHIGPVKWTYKHRKNDIVMALKTFTPGKDRP